MGTAPTHTLIVLSRAQNADSSFVAEERLRTECCRRRPFTSRHQASLFT